MKTFEKLLQASVFLYHCFDTVLATCHDEIVCLSRDEDAEGHDAILKRIMTGVPAWADGLPMGGRGWRPTTGRSLTVAAQQRVGSSVGGESRSRRCPWSLNRQNGLNATAGQDHLD